MVAELTMKELLHRHVAEGELYRPLDGNNKIECYACGHRCTILDGHDGICKVRFNREGKLLVPTGYVGALQCDPIEKKPFFHCLPGSDALSFGMLGCDLHCGYCQNWVTSQAVRDPKAIAPPKFCSAEQLVELAVERAAPVVASTYNEPLITSEWAVEVFRIAQQRGLLGAYISNGNGTAEVLDYLRPYVSMYKVDLKGFDDRNYRKLGGVLDNVLQTIKMLRERDYWIEVVTLVVPGFNDGDEELKQIAQFVASVSPDIPWHCTAFHSDYKMKDTPDTTVETLLRAAAIGQESGLKFVYPGNAAGRLGDLESTKCPTCHRILIDRVGYHVRANHLVKGHCPDCQAAIPGIWTDATIPQR